MLTCWISLTPCIWAALNRL
ncbi:mCG1028974, isoform CRA_a [Mus musculus]|nr:mCG1028974, isoform CRA_a [Mus musculus]EDL04996.1 mCG1028974, isoform CRA_a [Mus musculus]